MKSPEERLLIEIVTWIREQRVEAAERRFRESMRESFMDPEDRERAEREHKARIRDIMEGRS